MKRLKWITLFFMLVCILPLGGCTSVKDEDLLDAPKLSIKYEEVSKLINDHITDEFELINPIYGKNTASVQFVDLNNDTVDEIILLYKLTKDDYKMRATIFFNENEVWKMDSQISGIAYNINKIEYADLDGDKTKEVIVGWQGGSRYKKGLSIYSFKDNIVTNIYDGYYAEMEVADFTRDGIDDIILVNVNRNEGLSTAVLMKGTNKGVEVISKTEMDGYINGYYSVKVGKINYDTNGLFLDAGQGDHSSFTDVIMFDGLKLKNLFYDSKWKVTRITYRNEIRESKDINYDGIMDIPLITPSKGYKMNTPIIPPSITTWYDWNGGNGLVKVAETYQNDEVGYQILIPTEIINQYKVVHEIGDSDNVQILIIKDQEEKQFFDIRTVSRDFDINKKAQLEKTGHFLIESTDKYEIYGKIYTAEYSIGKSISSEAVKGMIELLNLK